MKNFKIDNKNTDFLLFSKKKIDYFKELITKTTNAYFTFRDIDIISSSEVNMCIKKIQDLYNRCIKIETLLQESAISKKETLEDLQKINNEFFVLIKAYGTQNIGDVLKVSFGADYIKKYADNDLFNIFQKHYKPFSFKVLPWNKRGQAKNKEDLLKNKIVEDKMIVENANDCDCFDLSRTHKNFYVRINGVKICFHNEAEKKTIIVSGLLDNILLSCYDNNYIHDKINSLLSIADKDPQFDNNNFKNFVDSLLLKDLLIYSNVDHCNKYVGLCNHLHLIKQKPISQLVKEFINDDIFLQRKTLMNLLIHNDDPETQYLAYLFYDLLSNDDKSTIDTKEQMMIYDSLPWSLKNKFKEAMKLTIDYTKNIANLENNKIPLEQQICLMRVNDNVKEKAMTKLKEIKAKSEDSGSKARQYLDGLLKIPFGIYKKEECLDIQKNMFQDLVKFLNDNSINTCNASINCVCSQDISNCTCNVLNSSSSKDIIAKIDNVLINEKTHKTHNLINQLVTNKRDKLIKIITTVNTFIKTNKLKHKKLIHSGKTLKFIRDQITNFIENRDSNEINTLINTFNIKTLQNNLQMVKTFNNIREQSKEVKTTMNNIRKILDDSVYGHDKAKRQIERIIGQWMSGEMKGYCFGFEGPPGVGKTSLAKKGLAKCLTDKDGNSRPFGFIAIGGSANGSTLDGHNYTYVGSTWGRIVDILMESKCMNPIIFIDELDKVSKTENGKEIIGILTHIVDPTQNDTFQDKYFNGIDIDLSKALFIFSYNDVSLLDRILLDRIHRVKFDNLSVKDKIVITRNYILPEIFEKINLRGSVIFNDEIIEHIIETYTCESGVRKLKEIFFEIISEINLELLREEQDDEIDTPIILTKDLLKTRYLKDHREVKAKTIHENNEVGIINGLWANALGQGGIIPIQTTYFPTSNFLELKLTGMQGDVMKESMNVAKSLAYKLTPPKRQKELIKMYKETNLQGLHIHCPEGAVPKDGPSAGTAITTCIYSLFNKKKIKKDIAITGEINLQGYVTAIGGLNLKILGGIKAGVKEFIYPQENQDDFNDFMDKYKDSEIVTDIKFYSVKHISEVFPLVFA